MNSDSRRNLIYTGPSMNRTLSTGDVLHLVSCEVSDLRCGDVIVFTRCGPGSAVAHRVVSIGKEGIRTRGDNNSDIDPEVLRPQDILGKVVAAERNHRIRHIHGGRVGILAAVSVRARRLVMAVLSATLRAPYRKLAASGALRRLLPRRLRPRVVCFQRPTGAEMELMIGQRSIGALKPGAHAWTIRPPFRLFVDETTLPSWEEH